MREWQHSKGLVPVLFSRRTTENGPAPRTNSTDLRKPQHHDIIRSPNWS